jgi:hypothetical protein
MGVEKTVTAISGFADLPVGMPDVQAFLACAVPGVQPEFTDDADMLAMEISNCVPKTSIGASPVSVNVSVKVGLIPSENAVAPDVIVEIRRRYIGVETPRDIPKKLHAEIEIV